MFSWAVISFQLEQSESTLSHLVEYVCWWWILLVFVHLRMSSFFPLVLKENDTFLLDGEFWVDSSFNSLKMLFCCLLPFFTSDEKFVIIQITVPLHVRVFSLAAFKICLYVLCSEVRLGSFWKLSCLNSQELWRI